MAECPECGEEIEDQFDVCWNCGAANPNYQPPDQSRGGQEGGDGDGDTESDDKELSVEQRLRRIQKTQQEQEKTLSRIDSQVGCIFWYMVFGIVVGILYAIAVVMNLS